MYEKIYLVNRYFLVLRKDSKIPDPVLALSALLPVLRLPLQEFR
jgi:hypothetical protein